MKGVKFNDIHSYKDLNLVLAPFQMPPAEPKTTFVDIPGADGSLDMTEANGEVKFKDREGSMTFSVLPQDDFEVKKTEVSNLLNGLKCKITLDKDPEFFYFGRLSVKDYKANKMLRQITVDFRVHPYKYKLNKTREVINFCKKNLIDLTQYYVNGNDFVYIENDTVHVKYSNYNGLMFQFKPIPVNPTKPYAFSYKVVGGDRIVIAFYDENGNNISATASTTGEYLAAYNGRYTHVGDGIRIKMSMDVASIQIGLCAMNTVGAGNYNEYSNIQLEVGEVATDYEKYTVDAQKDLVLMNNRMSVAPEITLNSATLKESNSIVHIDSSDSTANLLKFKVFGKSTQDGTPTPDAPIDIVNLGADGEFNVSLCGKNLLDISTTAMMSCNVVDASTGSVQLNIQNEYFALMQTAKFSNFILKNQGIPITFSVDDIHKPYFISVVLYGERANGSTYLEQSSSEDNFVTITPTDFVSVGKLELRIGRKSVTHTDTTTVYSGLQLVIGENVGSYEPYKEQKIKVATPNGFCGIPVSSGGNYKDLSGQQWICDEIDLVRGVYVQRVGIRKFNGKETYLDFISSVGGVTTFLPHCDKTPFICSHFNVGKSTWYPNSTSIGFTVADANCSTLDEFVAFVTEKYEAGTPITVYYILATPIETPLENVKFNLYAPITTIMNDESAETSIEYKINALVDFEGNTYAISEGTHKLLNIYLKQGEHHLSLTGSGSITFNYQEGAL